MRLAALLSLLAIANLGFGALQQWYVLLVLGPGTETDALFAGLAMPTLMVALISGPFTYVLIPLLAGTAGEDVWRKARLFFCVVACAATVVSAILWLLVPVWFALLVPGFSESGKALGMELTRIQLATIVF